MSTIVPTVYGHVIHSGGDTALQYWFYYAFNDGPINNHEGDWENIVVVLQSGTPVWAGYSEHQGGAKLPWSEVEKEGETHPVVYVARGSHANYFRSFSGKYGIQNDAVGGDGIALKPVSLGGSMQVVSLDSAPWLGFAGKWGYSGDPVGGLTGSDGPFGPSAGNHVVSWNNPAAWALSLPQTGGSMFMLEWLMFNFVLLFMIYLIVRGALKVFGVCRRAKSPMGLQVKRLIGSGFVIWLVLGMVGTALVMIGTIGTWFSASASIQSAEIQTNGPVEIINLNGLDGLRVNTLQKGQGLISLFNFGLPAGLVLLAGVIFVVLDLIGAKSGKSLGLKYVLGGITPVVYFVIVLIAIASLGSVVPKMTVSLGDTGMPREAGTMLMAISSSPMSGGWQGPMGGYANIGIWWGLGIGAYLMLIGGIIRILAGIAMMVASPKQQPKAAVRPLPQQQVVLYQQYPTQIPVQEYKPGQPPAAQKNICKHCGAETDIDSTFCDTCGSRVK
jgi:hypothetical protein